MRTVALTFRAETDLVNEVDALARSSGVSRSDYIRQALEEKNARALAQRMTFLSKALSARHLKVNNEIDASLGDGLADR